MIRKFMVHLLKYNIFILIIISFYSCSTTKQAKFRQPRQITSPQHQIFQSTVKKDSNKTAPKAKKRVKKADILVQKSKIVSANQSKEKTLTRKSMPQKFAPMLEKHSKNKHYLITSEPESNVVQEPESNVVQEDDQDALMSEYLFQYSLGCSFGNSDNPTEDIKKEMIASEFDRACEESVESPYEVGENPDKENFAKADDWQFYAKYSKKWGLKLDGTEDKLLILAIDKWLGTRYKWGGCSKYSGVDCSCLVKSIYEEVYNIKLSRTSRSIFFNDLIPIKKEELQEGDLICFKGKRNRISHIGLYLKNNRFVHSTRSTGVTIGDLGRGYYKKIFFSGGRVAKKRQ